MTYFVCSEQTVCSTVSSNLASVVLFLLRVHFDITGFFIPYQCIYSFFMSKFLSFTVGVRI